MPGPERTTRLGGRRAQLVFAGLLFAVQGCSGGTGDAVLTDEEMALLRTLGGPVEPRTDPTNAVEALPEAWAFGKALFYDERMSSDGTVACASCHDPAHGWADPRPFSEGVGGQRGGRHASTLTNVGSGAWQFWDGRADSLWSQPLQAIENPVEMDFTRLEVAHFVAAHYRSDYEALFGPLFDLSDLPARGRPGEPSWASLDESSRDRVQGIFTNVGKAIAAFVRTIGCGETALDRYLSGEEDALDAAALRGARLFVRDDRGRCISCHSGPNLSDDFFHNLGIPHPPDVDDRGRNAGIERLLADPFNGAGAYSDDPATGAERLRYLEPLPLLEGAFKTPTLRGVGQRPPYGHLGSMNLREWIDFHDRGGGDAARDHFLGEKESTLRPIGLSETDKEDLLAFLRALDCPAPDPRLLPSAGEEGP